MSFCSVDVQLMGPIRICTGVTQKALFKDEIEAHLHWAKVGRETAKVLLDPQLVVEERG